DGPTDTPADTPTSQPGKSVPEAPARSSPPGVLVILAHPDDEITIAPVLTRIARDGGKVTLIFATSGSAGPGISGMAPGEDLARLREDEGRCAAFALGLDEPIFWQLGDGELATLARVPDSAARRALALTSEAIAQTKPDVVMTWGPDGGYGHADHRMISAIVTQVVAGMGTGRPDLLYTAFPQLEEGALPQFESWAGTHPSLLTDRIRYRSEDLAPASAALDCYTSQFPPAARQGLIELLHESVWQGVVHFRLAFEGPAAGE
ncbi:MAG: PIG-L family deacetylase, partial [Pseudomonadota bacterium]